VTLPRQFLFRFRRCLWVAHTPTLRVGMQDQKSLR